MSDEHDAAHDGEHATPHLPPNSATPINVAFALALVFVGFLGGVRDAVGPTMWVLGLVWLAASVTVWIRGSIKEYRSLPEEGGH